MDVHFPSWDMSPDSIWALIKTSFAFMFIDIINVRIGKAYGFHPYQYGGTTIGGCSLNPSIVFKCSSTLRFIVDKLIEVTIISALIDYVDLLSNNSFEYFEHNSTIHQSCVVKL